MERARRRPVFRERKNPLIYFDDHDFISRYRLPKNIVRELSQRFAQSPYISTVGDPRGRGLHPEERVSIVLIVTIVIATQNIFLIFLLILFIFMLCSYKD